MREKWMVKVYLGRATYLHILQVVFQLIDGQLEGLFLPLSTNLKTFHLVILLCQLGSNILELF